MLTACKTSDATAKTVRRDAVYVCGCGPDCKCKPGVSLQPGKCGCGRDLVAAHLTRVERDVASACVCGTDCKCAVDTKDLTKCGCG